MPITFTVSPLDIDETLEAQGDEIATSSLPSAYQYLLSIPEADGGVDANFPQVAYEANFLSLSVPSGTTVSDLVWTHPTSSTNSTLVPFSTTTGFATTLKDVDGNTIYLFLDSTNSNVLIGRIGNSSTADAAFAIVLDEATNHQSAGAYLILYEAMGHPNASDPNDVIDLSDFVYVSAASTSTLSFSDFSDVPSGNTDFALIGPDVGQPEGTNILVTGQAPKGNVNGPIDDSTVNVSTQGLGSGSQSVGKNAVLQLDFVTGGAANTTGSEDQIAYTGHVENVTEAQFSLTQVNPNGELINLTVSAWDSNDANIQGAAFRDASASNVNITQVQVFDAAGNLIEDTDGTPNATGTNAVTATINANGDAVVTNLLVDYTVKVYSTGMDQVRITNTDNNNNSSFDVGEIQFSSTTIGQDNTAVGDDINFADDGPSIAQDITGGTVAFANGQTISDTFTSSTGSDDGAGVVIANFTDLPGLSEDLSTDGKTLTYLDGTTPVFRLTVDNDSYNFEVLKSQLDDTKVLNFDAIKAGGPKELIDVPTLPDANGNVDTVRFDGLIFTNTTDPTVAANNPGPTTDRDDANPDSLGFGVKDKQASQMNDMEGFSADLIQPADGEFSKFSFDIQGIGGIKSVDVTYWLVDEGQVIDLDPTSSTNKGLTTTVPLTGGNSTVNFDIDVSKATNGAYESVDQIYVMFDTPKSTQGVRVLNFTETQSVEFPPETMTFQLSNTDKDGDSVLSNSFTITADPGAVPVI